MNCYGPLDLSKWMAIIHLGVPQNISKNKLNKNYTSLLADVKQWMNVSENRVLQRNMAKIR
jgi:hypothetical protein